jgi:uncharacterized caspase-like protein
VQRKRDLYALVVGIGHFTDSQLDLPTAEADATEIANTLRTNAAPLFETVNVELLTKPADTTREQLLIALARYRGLSPDDVFVFYVASHGAVAEDSSKEYFLVSSNVDGTSDASLRKDALTEELLKTRIFNIGATRKMLVFDTCHAGAAGDALLRTFRVLSGAGMVLAASTTNQQAFDDYQGHGVFTWVLLQGLKGDADSSSNGYVTTLDLATYAYNKVPGLAMKVYGEEQRPTVYNSGEGFRIVSTDRLQAH